jgi:hypothetical protein
MEPYGWGYLLLCCLAARLTPHRNADALESIREASAHRLQPDEIPSPPTTPTTAVVLAGGAIDNARSPSASIQP